MNTERLLQGFKDDIAADVHCAVRRFKMTLIVNQVQINSAIGTGPVGHRTRALSFTCIRVALTFLLTIGQITLRRRGRGRTCTREENGKALTVPCAWIFVDNYSGV